MTRLTLPAADGSSPATPCSGGTGPDIWRRADGRRFGVEACFFAFTDETLLPQHVRDDLRGAAGGGRSCWAGSSIAADSRWRTAP